MSVVRRPPTASQLQDEGYIVFPPLAKRCLELCGDNHSEKDKAFVIALIKSTPSGEQALILSTERTAERAPHELQNIEVLLADEYNIADVDREEVKMTDIQYFMNAASMVEDAMLTSRVKKTVASTSEYSESLKKFSSDIVAEAVRKGASDIHYTVGEGLGKVEFRIDGLLHDGAGRTEKDCREMMSSALQICGKGFSGLEDDAKDIDIPLHVNIELDGAIEKIILRLNRTGQEDGYHAVMRVIRYRIEKMELEQLGYAPDQQALLSQVLDSPYGIFLCTGPVGSGKSTALTAILEMFDPDKKGVTIEDPIEYKIHHKRFRQFQIDPNAKDAIAALTKRLKHTLRQDPDLVGVSEVRSAEVAKLLIGFSQAGRVMVSTLHTNEAILSLARLADLGVHVNDLASPDTFLAIMNQRLMGNLCQDCSFEDHVEGVGAVWRHNPEGCPNCKKGKVKGRTVCAEILQTSVEDEDFIRQKAWYQWREDLIRRGFRTMALRAVELNRERRISWTDVEKEIPHGKVVAQHIAWAKAGPVSSAQADIANEVQQPPEHVTASSQEQRSAA